MTRVAPAITLALLVAAGAISIAAQNPAGTPLPPLTSTVAPDIPGVVAGGTVVQALKDGFNGSEGPIALPDGSVIFSETTANRIIRIDASDTMTPFLENTDGANGTAFDSAGRLFATHVTWGKTKVSIIYPRTSAAVLVDAYEGKAFGRANDLTVARNGGIYFTDSANPTVPQTAPLPLPAALYYVPPNERRAIQVLTDVAFPNGVILSRDEKTLYLNNTNGEYVIAFDVQPNGSLTNRRNFARYEGITRNANGIPIGGGDGITLDSAGRLYAATPVGVQVFSPQGTHLGTIPIPRPPQNLAFAGTDKKTLYIVGRGAVSKVRMLAEGFKERAK